MTARQNIQFVVAPRFHLAPEWPRRLKIGQEVDQAVSRLAAVRSWREPNDDDLSLLVRAVDRPVLPSELEACVSLFQLPQHLWSAWWQLLQGVANEIGSGRVPGFESFVRRVAEFLTFKGLPFPEGGRCDLILNPGRDGSFVDPTDARRRSESAGDSEREAENTEQRTDRLWGCINAGAEDASLVLVDLLCREPAGETCGRLAARSSRASVGEAAGPLSGADYIPVRLTLGPGEGCRLPQDGLIVDTSPVDEQGTRVLLLFWHRAE